MSNTSMATLDRQVDFLVNFTLLVELSVAGNLGMMHEGAAEATLLDAVLRATQERHADLTTDELEVLAPAVVALAALHERACCGGSDAGCYRQTVVLTSAARAARLSVHGRDAASAVRAATAVQEAVAATLPPSLRREIIPVVGVLTRLVELSQVAESRGLNQEP